MEKFYSNIIGTPVLEEDSMQPVTTVKDIIMDPERGTLVALVTNLNKNLVIAPVDVRAWKDTVRIHNRHVIVDAKDVLRVGEVQKKGIRILHNKVESENGEYLGRVFDFSIDENAFSLKKLFTAKGFLGILRFENRIIPAKNIIEILPEKIIVKGGLKTVKEEAKEKVPVKDMAMG